MTTATIVSPDEYAHTYALSLRAADAGRSRSQQTIDGIVGVSDLFSCMEKVRRTVTETPWTDVPSTGAAWVGSAIHEAAAAARRETFPHLLIEQELHITLPSGLTILGHADEIDPDEPSVTDLKSVDGLAAIRKNGPDENQRIQRAVYYYGAMQAGLVGPEGVCRNIWIDRSGKDPEPFVSQEPFDMAYVQAADLWLTHVVDAVKDGSEAPKEWPLWKCKNFCPWFTACRGRDRAEQVTDHPDTIAAAQEVYESRRTEKTAKELVQDGIRRLDGFEGVAGDFRVKHVQVNGSEKRRGHLRCDVERISR